MPDETEMETLLSNYILNDVLNEELHNEEDHIDMESIKISDFSSLLDSLSELNNNEHILNVNPSNNIESSKNESSCNSAEFICQQVTSKEDVQLKEFATPNVTDQSVLINNENHDNYTLNVTLGFTNSRNPTINIDELYNSIDNWLEGTNEPIQKNSESAGDGISPVTLDTLDITLEPGHTNEYHLLDNTIGQKNDFGNINSELTNIEILDHNCVNTQLPINDFILYEDVEMNDHTSPITTNQATVNDLENHSSAITNIDLSVIPSSPISIHKYYNSIDDWLQTDSESNSKSNECFDNTTPISSDSLNILFEVDITNVENSVSQNNDSVDITNRNNELKSIENFSNEVSQQNPLSSVIRNEEIQTNVNPRATKIKSNKENNSGPKFIRIIGKDTTLLVQCYYCKDEFDKANELKAHLLNKHKNERYIHVCKSCGKSYTSVCQVNRHRREKHFSNLKYICQHCGERFERKENLVKHENVVHLKLKKFKCEHCNKTFATKSNLLEHIQTHLENDKSEREFECQICKLKFRRRDKLRRHENTVHSDARNWECTICNKTFKRKDKYSEHVKNHSKPKIVYNCEYCNQIYKRPQGLATHKKVCKKNMYNENNFKKLR